MYNKELHDKMEKLLIEVIQEEKNIPKKKRDRAKEIDNHKNKRIAFRVTEEMYNKIDIISKKTGDSVSDILTNQLIGIIDRYEALQKSYDELRAAWLAKFDGEIEETQIDMIESYEQALKLKEPLFSQVIAHDFVDKTQSGQIFHQNGQLYVSVDKAEHELEFAVDEAKRLFQNSSDFSIITYKRNLSLLYQQLGKSKSIEELNETVKTLQDELKKTKAGGMTNDKR